MSTCNYMCERGLSMGDSVTQTRRGRSSHHAVHRGEECEKKIKANERKRFVEKGSEREAESGRY